MHTGENNYFKDKVPRVLLAHPGRQHSFRLATALKEAGFLFKYVTTVYDKKDSLLMKTIKLFINKENQRRASNRRCFSLEDSDVVLFDTFWSVFLLLIIRLDKNKAIARWLNDVISISFQKKLAKYAIKKQVDAVICYDANCRICFNILKQKAPTIIRIMDNAAPNRNYLYDYFTKNRDKCGPFIKSMSVYKYLFSRKEASRFVDEIRLVDYHFVASNFSKRALEYDKVPNKSIYVIPYGINNNQFASIRRVQNKNDEQDLNLLFVGEVTQRKGIFQICEAAKIINNPKIHFNIVGSGFDAQKEELSSYQEWVSFHGTAYFEELINHYEKNDMFIFPSMGDGFGLVLLEAMASGLPIIASSASAGPDLIVDGKEGFIIEPCCTKQLVDKIMWAYDNKPKLYIMGMAAREKAIQFSWSRYNRLVVSALCDIFLKRKEYV